MARIPASSSLPFLCVHYRFIFRTCVIVCACEFWVGSSLTGEGGRRDGRWMAVLLLCGTEPIAFRTTPVIPHQSGDKFIRGSFPSSHETWERDGLGLRALSKNQSEVKGRESVKQGGRLRVPKETNSITNFRPFSFLYPLI